jgi:phosphotriesterase-related protein
MHTRREFLTQVAAAGALAAASSLTAAVPAADIVQTVLGPLAAAKLGFTLTHEHLGGWTPEFQAKWPQGSGDRAGYIAKAVDKLKAIRDAGVNTVVDLTPYDVGRDVRSLQEVSLKSGMHVVACTGQHLFPPESMLTRSLAEMAELFRKEIEEGIDGTDVRAGVIKVATRSNEISAFEDKVLRAAARVSKVTGVAIQTHTHARLRAGEMQAGIFESEGVSSSRVALGHSDDSGDLDYFIGLCKRGYTLNMDHMNYGLAPNAALPWQKRADNIKRLIDAGFTQQLLFSQDSMFSSSLLPQEARDQREQRNPDGMLFSIRKLIPYLIASGVAKAAIHTITVENPRRFLVR